MRRFLLALTVLTILGVGVAIGVGYKPWSVVGTTPTSSATPPPPEWSDPYFSAMADKLGLTKEGRYIFQSAKPHFSDSFSAQGEQGEYRTDTGIAISSSFKNRFDREAVTLVAHEFLHEIWWQQVTENALANQQQYQHLSSLLLDYYNRSPALRDRMVYGSQNIPGWIDNQSKLVSELHSVEGTEVTDSLLPPELLEWYRRWLPNRDVLSSNISRQ